MYSWPCLHLDMPISLDEGVLSLCTTVVVEFVKYICSRPRDAREF